MAKSMARVKPKESTTAAAAEDAAAAETYEEWNDEGEWYEGADEEEPEIDEAEDDEDAAAAEADDEEGEDDVGESSAAIAKLANRSSRKPNACLCIDGMVGSCQNGKNCPEGRHVGYEQLCRQQQGKLDATRRNLQQLGIVQAGGDDDDE